MEKEIILNKRGVYEENMEISGGEFLQMANFSFRFLNPNYFLQFEL